ncbi:MAG: transposase [Leptospiraceae bacterium]|nr:transposase [Leptospiraceae bacterium]MCP5513740.1 transposase [Leptospiraceae bacterium]
MALTTKSDQKTREKAVQYFKSGKRKREISEKLDIDIATVYRWEKKFLEDKHWLEKGPGAGRHTKLDLTTMFQLVENLKSNPVEFGFENNLWTNSRIQTHLRKKYKLDVSLDLLLRFLNRIQMKFERPKKSKALSENLKNQRFLDILEEHKPIVFIEYESKLDFSSLYDKKSSIKMPNELRNVYAKVVMSPGGHLYFRFYDKTITLQNTLDFYSELMEFHINRKILMIPMDFKILSNPKFKSFKSQFPKFLVLD